LLPQTLAFALMANKCFSLILFIRKRRFFQAPKGTIGL
jgi:hypothetical protein